jgi:hypothetical protein
VQIVHSSHRGSRDIEHIGSAHDDAGLELLKAAARQRLAAGQGVLDLGLGAGAPGGPLPIISSQMRCLVDALSCGYRVLGFDQATAGDEVFFQLVLARIIEPVSKLDSLQVLEEAGVTPARYRTVTRRLRWPLAPRGGCPARRGNERARRPAPARRTAARRSTARAPGSSTPTARPAHGASASR